MSNKDKGSNEENTIKKIELPRYTVDTYMASKGYNVKGEMGSG